MLSTSLLCLAMTIYMESRGEPENGQVAVGYTVINRVEHNRSTKVCTVANSKEYTWNKKAKVKDFEAFKKCKELAARILTKSIKDPTYGATHFHHKRIKPEWRKQMIKTLAVGHHIFYKYKDG